MKKYILTTIAIVFANILLAQEPKSDTSKTEHVDSILMVIHANDYRLLIQKLDQLIDSKVATRMIIDLLNSSTRKYDAIKPKQPGKTNKEQPK